MDNIRVTYSGLLGFAVAMGGILAGLVFTVLVTRQLEPEEFGVWAVIGSMTTYSIISGPVIFYWTTRQVARGMPVSKTSMASASIFAGGSVPIYIISVYLFASIEPVYIDVMILGAILIPVLLVEGALKSINIGHKPHIVSIGDTAFHSLKIPAGFALVFFLDFGLSGAILAVFAAHLASIAIHIHYAKTKLAVLLDFSYLRAWIRQAWIPLYVSIPHVLVNLDIIIYTTITSSVVGVAYYAAAMVVAKLVARAGRISQALYPKLLAEGSREHITENLTWLLYFAVPMLIMAAIFSRHAMFLLNPEYAGAWMAGVLLAFNAFLHVLIDFFQKILMGTDIVDIDEMPRASSLLKSKLFLVGTVANAHYLTYLAVLTAVLYSLSGLTDLDLVVVWSATLLAASTPFALYYGILVRRHAPFRVPYRVIPKHLVGGVGIVTVFVLTSEHIITFEISIFSYLPGLLLEVALCCAAYLGITYAIDHKTRKLFGLVLSEITSGRKSSE